MTEHLYTMTTENLTGNACFIKNLIADQLEEEGTITKEKADDLRENYAIIVHERGRLGKFWDKVMGNEGKGPVYSIVKKA